MNSKVPRWDPKYGLTLLVCIMLLSSLVSPLESSHQSVKSNTSNSYVQKNCDEISTTMYFVENVGQIESSNVLFYGYMFNTFVGLSRNAIYLNEPLSDFFLELRFIQSHPSQVTGVDGICATNNFILGSRGNYLNVACYTEIMYENIWPNIDLKLQLTSDGLKTNYIISSGGDESNIHIKAIGNNCVDIEMIEHQIYDDSPIILYDGYKVHTEFFDETEDTYGFHIVEDMYSSTSIISQLLFSTYIGGSDSEFGKDIVVDSLGNTYITGSVASVDFPLIDSYDSVLNNDGSSTYTDCFVMKFDSLRNLVYSTFIGGSLSDMGSSITVNNLGDVYITGRTKSYDFPIFNAFDDTFGGTNSNDCFLLKLNASGNGLIYSTYIGDSFGDEARGICIDDDGNVYVTGITESQSFPTVNAYDESYNTGWDCFVLKMNSTGTGLIYSTYIGGSFTLTPPYADNNDIAEAITIDSFGNAYVTGYTNSQSFPTENAYDDTLSSWNIDDCFIFKLNATGNSLLYSTYIGGIEQDRATDISIDSEGCAYITGSTQSTDFPLLNGYDESLNGTSDAFLVKLNPDGDQLLYSTLLGGNDTDSGRSLVCDELDNIYLGGITTSSDFPVIGGVQYNGNGSNDCFVLKFNITTKSLMYSTCVGGTMNDSLQSIIIDSYGTVYATGGTYSEDFPVVNAYDGTHNGMNDVFVFLLPDFGDSDADGIPDFNESLYGTDRFSADSDFDGLGDFDEIFTYLTNPMNNDSDSDLMSDGWEVQYSFNPLDPSDAELDIDNDLLSNLGEYQQGTLPDNWDTDSDLMSDGWEVQYELDPLDPDDASGDPDSDSLTNLQEYELGTNPRSSDSDLDGIPDNWEVSMGFDPLDPEVPLVEFLLFNMHITVLLCIVTIGACIGIFYRIRPRLEERRTQKRQDDEHEEIQSVIKDLSANNENQTQIDSELYDDEDMK